MRKFNFFTGLVLLLILNCAASCGSSSAEQTEEETNETVSPQDYVGKYDVKESRDRIFVDVLYERDSLFFYSHDRGTSFMVEQDKEIFDVPGHDSKLRFMRNTSGEVDRIIMLTPKGRYTAMKLHPDSVNNIVDTLKTKMLEFHKIRDSLKTAEQPETAEQ